MNWAKMKARKGKCITGRTEANAERGFSLLELLMVTAIIGVLSAIAIPVMGQAVTTAEKKSMTSEGRTLHSAFKSYYLDHNDYPGSLGDLVSFAPLSSQGYYRGSAGSRLNGETADAYGSPDDDGQNQEFWLEMTLATDTTVRLLVADSDDAPLGGGDPYDGVYVFINGVLETN